MSNIEAIERLLQRYQQQWLRQQIIGTTKDDLNGNMLPNMDLTSFEGGLRFLSPLPNLFEHE